MKPAIAWTLLVVLLAACASPAPTPTTEPTSAPSATPEPTAEPTEAPTPTEAPAPIGERTTLDRPDDFPGLYQFHFLYVTLSDSPDMERDLNGEIDQTVADINTWFAEQTGGSTLRVDTFQGELDITYVQLDMTNTEFINATVGAHGAKLFLRDQLELELDALEILEPGKLYVAMFEINEQAYTCADSAHLPELRGRVAGLYPSAVLDDGYNCASESFGRGYSYTDMSVIHEMVHLLSFATRCGENPTSRENFAHTGDDNRDLMWAPYAADSRYWDTDHMLLDPGNDDYFNLGESSSCRDLANSAFLEPLPSNADLPLSWPPAWEFAE